MPYRKYTPKQGKHGPIYRITRGITVCRNDKGMWLIKIEQRGTRKNKTVGKGRDALKKAIKAAEAISKQLSDKERHTVNEQQLEEHSAVPYFADYSSTWLKNTAGRVRPTTEERYEGILRIHIWPNKWFSSKRLCEIKRVDVKKLLRGIYRKRSPATVEVVQTVIHSIFEDAIDDEIISNNPARLILKKILPAKRKRRLSEPQPLTRNDANILLKQAGTVCPKSVELSIKVMLYGGLRLGEAISLRVGYLDFRKRAYRVTETYKRGIFSQPKSGNARWVDLPDFLLNELRQHILSLKKDKLRRGNPGDISLLFPDYKQSGQPYSQRKIQTALKKLCTKAGIGRRSPHDLRHSYASWLLMDHYSPAYVQKQLGHSSIEITVGTYGHWIDGEGRPDLESALQLEQDHGEKRIFPHMEKEKASQLIKVTRLSQ